MSITPTTLKTLVGIWAVAFMGAGYVQAGRQQVRSAAEPRAETTQASSAGLRPPSPQRAILNRYCVSCHNDKMKTAELVLDRLDVDDIAVEHWEQWEKVVGKLRSEAMPPPGRRRPDKATYESLAGWLETRLDRIAAAHPNPGRPTVHRLNRVEYTNAIRDLLALEIDGRALLPADGSGFGFDNIADVLSVSPLLLQRYMLAADKISRLAIGDPPTMPPAAEIYRVSPSLVQDDRMSEELPFRSRGGTVIRHYFPVDGEYVVEIRLRRAFTNNAIRGLADREQLDIRLDSERVKLFTIGGECVGSTEPRCVKPPGLIKASPYELTADEGLEVRVSAKAGMHVLGVTFIERSAAAKEGAGPVRLPARSSESFDEQGEMSLDSVEVHGPFKPSGPGDTLSRRRIFVCRPALGQSETACAKKILATLARRAYRRPVRDPDLEGLLGLYRAGRAKGSFDTGIRFALEGMLVSPNFLLRVEREPANVAPGAPYRISDLELASRLSFFLWSSIPDDELIDVAERKQLSDPRILEQQVRRMLADPRGTTLVTNFASQWLHLRDLQMVSPDPRRFPDFDESLRKAFQLETELFLESQIREDRSIVDLLKADYTFVNERLARFYGIPNVFGERFRRIDVADPNRVGLLGHGSILTVTSYSTRTSPVVRGNFVLANILGAPPAPPPPDVPALKETREAGEPPTSVRDRMEQHRRNPACAVCHNRIDPMGFALENFDAIGKWRTRDGGVPVDASGAFPDGTKFTTPAEFRAALLDHRDEFVRTATTKLLTYALGRGTEYYDMPAVRRIIRDAAASDYRWSALILGIVNSVPFQMRKAYEEEPEATNSSSQVRGGGLP